MKLFQVLTPLSLFSIAALAALASTPVLADHRHDDRYDSRSNSSWDRSYSNRHASNRKNAGRNKKYGHKQPNYRSNYHPNYSPRHNDSWSISVNLGSGYYPGYNIGYSSYPGYAGNSAYRNYGNAVRYPRTPAVNHTTVIYQQPSVVYVNEPTSRVSSQRAEPGLLRDINGNCFERSYDSQGRENRRRLPDSACNF